MRHRDGKGKRRELSARDVVMASLVSLGACAGIVLVADGLHTPRAPRPTAAQALEFAPLQQPVLAPATPTRVRIPAIHVDAPLTGIARDARHHVSAPPESNRNLAGYVRDGTAPGAVGTAVISGRVDSRQGPAVFHSLGALKKGDTVAVDRADKQSAEFTVDAVEAYDVRAFPEEKVYGPSAHAELRLVACGAGFDKRHGRSSGNVVVYAHLTAVRPVPAASGAR
jgi:sortase (surface protein transpeptidase)